MESVSSEWVSAEVSEFPDRANHKTGNLFHEQRCQWDRHEFNGYIMAYECS